MCKAFNKVTQTSTFRQNNVFVFKKNPFSLTMKLIQSNQAPYLQTVENDRKELEKERQKEKEREERSERK